MHLRFAFPSLVCACLLACGASESAGVADPGAPASAQPGPPPGGGAGATPKTCSGAGGGGALSDLFACDNVWYRDVSGETPAPESAAILDAIGAWGAKTFSIDFSLRFMTAGASDPRVSFTLGEASSSDATTVPIPPGGAIEGQDGYQCVGGGSCRLLVVDPTQKKLFEITGANNAGGAWFGSRQVVWDLTRAYGPEGRGYGCPSADPAGLPVTVGLIGLREVKGEGVIRHALRFALPADRIRKGPSYVYPATHGASTTTSAAGPPFGARLRLKAVFDERRVTDAGGKVVVRALKKHGMILADVGTHTLMAEEPLVAKRADPSLTWADTLTDASLSILKTSDFEVVGYSPIHTGATCVLK
jgi:serine/threonine-protein kinase